MKTHRTWNACIQIYKHLDVRNAESRLNITHQAELCPLRLCSALRWVESANWSAACSTSFWSVSYFILEASWITSASKTSRDSQYGLFSVDTCSNNNKNKFITCSLCSTEGKKGSDITGWFIFHALIRFIVLSQTFSLLSENLRNTYCKFLLILSAN